MVRAALEKKKNLIHLERAIDNMHSASPTHLSFDSFFYLALSSLPLTYPWSILTIDLKGFLSLMDRHVLTHLVAAQTSIKPEIPTPCSASMQFLQRCRGKDRVSFFLLYAAWVRSRAERPSVSYTKVVSNVAWTGHNLQFTKTN